MELDGHWRELSGWMMSWPEEVVLWILEFWKDGWVEVQPLKVAVGFFGFDEQKWNEILDITRCAEGGGCQLCMVSIGFYDLRLSSSVAKDRG